jgi:hypothetical protein
MPPLDLAAPLEPLIGLGPLKLLDNVFTVRRLMLDSLSVIEPNSLRQGAWEMAVVFSDWVRFSYQDTIHIYALLYTGLIVRIEVTGTYQGKVRGIGIGGTVRDMQRAFPEVTFDEGIVYVIDLDLHFVIDAEHDFDSLAEVADNRVTAIRLCASQHSLALAATSLAFTS